MACRVGMSTTPYTRMKYWREEEGYTKSAILGKNLTYEEALALEAEKKKEYDCDKGSPGGERVPGAVWSVYIVHN